MTVTVVPKIVGSVGYDPTAVAITGGNSLWDDGSAAAPSIAFAAAPTTGFWRTATGRLMAGVAGTSAWCTLASTFGLVSNGNFGWCSGDPSSTSLDTIIARLAAGSAGMTTGRWSVKQGAAVASAAEVTLGSDGNRFQITGTTQIDKILITGWQGGSIVTLHFQGSVTVTHNTANNGSFHGFRLAGAANFSATANDQLTLQYDSTSSAWFEIARVVI